jgi:hypothetical protein
MQFKTQALVIGLKRGKGAGDGKSLGADVTWDFTKAVVHQDLTERKGNSRGQGSTDIKIGPFSDYEKLEKHALPFMCEFDMRITTDGKGGQATECFGYKVLPTEVKKSV